MPTRLAADLVGQVVRESVAVVCARPADQVTDQTLLDDVGADSLARVGIADLVEERLATQLPRLHIPDDDLAGFMTVGDVTGWVTAHAAALA